jgi:hypothetical protein
MKQRMDSSVPASSVNSPTSSSSSSSYSSSSSFSFPAHFPTSSASYSSSSGARINFFFPDLTSAHDTTSRASAYSGNGANTIAAAAAATEGGAAATSFRDKPAAGSTGAARNGVAANDFSFHTSTILPSAGPMDVYCSETVISRGTQRVPEHPLADG